MSLLPVQQHHIYDIEDRFILNTRMTTKPSMILTTRRPMILTTRINKIEQDIAVTSIRSVFPETWIFDLIDDTTLGYHLNYFV